MDEKNVSKGAPMAEVAEDEYELEADDTQDLDDAMREALEAVERSEDELEIAARAAGAGGDEEAGAEPDGPEFARLQEELAELRDRSVRTLADFDNYRKRVEREKQAQQRYDGMEVLRGLLDIVDNLERALASDGPVDDLKAGVELTLRQAEDLLRRHGVSRIEADGEPFDPSLHEAVSRLEDDGVSEPRVTAVLQSGYQMHERLLRPVRVAVAVPATERTRIDVDSDGNGAEEG